MFGDSLVGLSKKKLRLWLSLFFLALAIPMGVLAVHAYDQLKWEAFHQHRVLAEELAGRVDTRFVQLIDEEEARSFADYSFLNVAGDSSASFLQRSPLSIFPVASDLPGMIGYFQIDTQGLFSTPLLPQPGVNPRSYGISAGETSQRLALQNRVQRILSENQLAQRAEPDANLERVRSDDRRDKAQRLDALAKMAPLASPAEAEADADLAAPLEAQHASIKSEVAALRDETVSLKDEQTLAARVSSQAAFDRLNVPALREQEEKQKPASKLGRVEDLKLALNYQSEPQEAQRKLAPAQASAPAKRARKERSALPEPEDVYLTEEATEAADAPSPQSGVRIRTFESEIDPFELSLLPSGHFVLFRKVWRDGQRYIQGALIEQRPLLAGLIQSAFRETVLSQMSELIVAHEGNVLSAFSGRASSEAYLSRAEELSGELLYRTRLSDPLGAVEVIFSIKRLPPGPGGRVIVWTAVILALVLIGGFALLYRLGAGQIDLARQQQDFVSAVSHELKTPLTSIRMYGEILREGWATEEKKKSYYDYIHDESERLSRLISNVLQLARMTRNEVQVDPKPMTVAGLMDGIQSKVCSQIEHAGFAFNIECGSEAGQASVDVDADGFSQIVINLVDNAIKFSANAEIKTIEVGCRLLSDRTVCFSVRDHGPGVPRDQMRKIFKLFYRSENELTRDTVGTGIGLALAHQLAQAMDGKLDVVNQEPGAEFRLSFKALQSPDETNVA